MIKVLHLVKTLSLGGAELNLFNLVQATDTSRFEVHVGYSYGGELEEKFITSDAKLFKFARESHKIKSLASVSIIIKLIVYIIKNKIDVIHTHSFNTHVWGGIAARLTGTKVLEHVHDSRYLAPEQYEKSREFNRQYKFGKYFKSLSDIVIVLTRQNREFVISNGYHKSDQVRIILNGSPMKNEKSSKEDIKKVLAQKFGISPQSLVMLTPTRLSPEKNIGLIIQIAKDVKKECPEAVFIISGDGPMLNELKEKCKEHALEDSIKFIGFYSKIFDLLRITDIFLLPSFLELHSIAILEALSMKVPVVVSRVGSNEEFIENGKNGFILDPFAVQQWKQTVIQLLKDKHLRQSIGQTGYSLFCDRFDMRHVVKHFEDIYVELSGK